MVTSIINQTIVGKNNTLCSAAALSFGINITFIILSTVLLWQQTFIVTEFIPADGCTFFILFYTAATPAKVLCLRLGNKVIRQLTLSINIKCHIILTVIPAIFINRRFRCRCSRRLWCSSWFWCSCRLWSCRRRLCRLRCIGSDNFVGEDTVEINSHGGIVVTQKILDLVLSHGARLATKGEFTRRSYLNGKISLIKAEAINSLINAKTSKQHRIAINSFDLEREKKIQDFLKSLEYLIGLCEINIDYPEYDDVPILENKKFIEKVDELVEQLNKITKHSEANKIFVSQLNVAIVGEPNAGKSSLINAMLNEDKSIVTNIPGTTRDVVEAEIVFNDLVLKFKDTAGIRESNDEIEKIGIDKS